jgi:hypothetical protein
MKWFFILIVNISAFSQSDPCYYFEQQSKEKLTGISNKIVAFENPFYLSKKELFSIVSPEYITYSIQMNDLEVILVKSNLVLNNNKFDLSFGPFQMKISFILKTLNQAPMNIINDPILVKLKKNYTKMTFAQIDYLNKIETQWKILRLFEYCNKEIYTKKSLNGLYSIYNRGDIKKKLTIFEKIKCRNKTYEEWCADFFLII